MSLNSIKLIVFDLDGTLLDSVLDLAMASDKAITSLGYPSVSEQQIRDYVGNGADVLIARALSQSLTINPKLTKEVKTLARERFNHFYAQTGHKLSHLYPNVKETLMKLHAAGYILAIVTNKPSSFLPDILAQHGIDELFTDVVGGDTFPKNKPDPMGLNWLLDKHNLAANEMLMVGDSKNDILAAQRAQCYSFGLTYGYNHGEPIVNTNPDYVADDIAQLINLLSA